MREAGMQARTWAAAVPAACLVVRPLHTREQLLLPLLLQRGRSCIEL